MVHKKYIQILTTLTAAFAFAFVASVQEVHAADVDFSVVVSEVPVLEITLSDSTAITPTTISQNIKPNPDGTPTFTTSDIYVTVATSNPTGYYLNMHTNSTSLISGANEIPSLDNEYACTINTASSCAFTNNSWGYRLSTDTANTYKPIPNSTGEDIDSYDTVTNGRTVNVIFGTKIDSSLPAGSYATTISFVATANPTGPRYLQDVTIDTCPTDGLTVYDSRDDEPYLIRKLTDGNCWMLDNLRLDPATAKTLTTDNTNMSPSKAFFLPVSSAAGFTDDASGYQYARIYAGYKDTRVTSYGPGSGKVGVYYNYCAASAGTYCAARSSANGDARYDICPKGWKMPKGDTSNGSYHYLLNTGYSGNQTATDTGSLQYNLSAPLSGAFVNGEQVSQGSAGFFWTSTSYPNISTHMGSVYVYATEFNPQGGGSRYNGLTMRCILK